MDLLQIVALSALQGLTEFLPVSSSAHLVLLPQLQGWADQGLAFDVAVHVGSLSAVAWYFRRQLTQMARDWIQSLMTRKTVGESRLAWAVLFATIPVGSSGLVFEDAVETTLRAPMVIAWATIGFAMLLWWADARGRGRRDESGIGWKDVFFIGAAQALALIPGTSRSGVTMTAGLMRGLSRSAAARFSFLLSIPVIMLAGGLQLHELGSRGGAVDWRALVIGCATSGIAAYLCIHVFLKLLERIGMLPFVIYRLLLGGILVYSGT